MWHEARRQEKQLRARMVDGSKRAERRRKFYDSVRRDPDQFMQVHGSQCIIHTERSIARAAADANILRSWQGDPTIKIDRFDVRSHLETVDPVEGVHELTTMEEKEELICNFERYRLLIMNEFKDITEKAVLKNIADKEFWLTGQTEDQRKLELDKRRKTIDSKASIGFRYDDSETVAGKNEPGSSSEDEMQVEQLDADLEIYLNNPDSSKRCNKIGESFGIKDNHFCALFRADQQAQKTAAEIKRIDRQKAALVGRESKDDRRLLKQERAILIANARQDDALVSLSSFAKKEEKKPIIVESSSSSDDEPARAEYILSFGDDGGNNKSKKHRKRKSNRNGRERRKSCSRDRRRRSSSSSGRRRRRSYSRRSRSRSRERRRSRDRRSRSRDRDRKRHRRSRSRSYDRKRRRDDSSSSRSRSPKKRSDKRMFVPKMAEAPKFQDPMESAQSSDDNGPIAVLEIRSSMSESEQERTEIENRKRRIRLTKKMVKSKAGEMARSQAEAEEKKNSEQVEAIKKKMKKALKATVDELKEEEEEKKREVERERRIRDESIRIEQEERRAREQKKIDEQRKADLGRAILNAKLLAEAQIAQKIREQQSEDGS